MEGHVNVIVTTCSRYDGGEDVLVFTGSGLLKRTQTGWRLRYSAKGEDGSPAASDVELRDGCATVRNITGGYTLQLDPASPSAARIPTEVGALTMSVVTEKLNWALEGESSGRIHMHYKLLALQQTLSDLRVSIHLTNKRGEKES